MQLVYIDTTPPTSKERELERACKKLGWTKAMYSGGKRTNKRKVEKLVRPIAVRGEKQVMQLDITFSRHSISKRTFNVDTPYTLALLGRSKALFEAVKHTKNAFVDFQRKKHQMTMVSLLDFACRFEYDAKDANFDHGLNVDLHAYQVQSLRWMIDEERHEVGFYRHFFAKGRFADDSPFWLSAMLGRLIVGGELPRVHGGILCEEMGLGKTIISLALIRCNRSNGNYNCSTKHAHRI